MWMLGIVSKIGLLWLTVLTLLNAGYIHIEIIYDFHAQLQRTGSGSDVFRYD